MFLLDFLKKNYNLLTCKFLSLSKYMLHGRIHLGEIIYPKVSILSSDNIPWAYTFVKKYSGKDLDLPVEIHGV